MISQSPEEVWESTLLKSQREPEEKKLTGSLTLEAVDVQADALRRIFSPPATGSVDAAITCAVDPLAVSLSPQGSGSCNQADARFLRRRVRLGTK